MDTFSSISSITILDIISKLIRLFKLLTKLINILFDVIAHFNFLRTIYISGTDDFKRYQGKTKLSLRRIKFYAFIGKLISVNAFYIL